MCIRDRIKAQLTQAEDDNKKFQSKELLKKSEKIKKPVVNELDEAIEKIEAQMLELIKSDESINENYKIAQSVPGVGKIVAVAFICATNNFTKFETAKALGSYCCLLYTSTLKTTCLTFDKDWIISSQKTLKNIQRLLQEGLFISSNHNSINRSTADTPIILSIKEKKKSEAGKRQNLRDSTLEK